MAIPLIYTKNAEGTFSNLVARAANGSGKTGAFTIGTILRVEKDVQGIQVICVVNTRELCNQIAMVYRGLAKDTGITVSNFNEKKDMKASIVVTTFGALDACMNDARRKINLKSLKCIVYDEADVFFLDDKNY